MRSPAINTLARPSTNAESGVISADAGQARELPAADEFQMLTVKDNRDEAVSSGRVVSRVCLITTDYDTANGGLQTISKNLIKQLNKEGLSTFICCRNYSHLPPNEVIDGSQIHRTRTFKFFPTVLNSLSFFFDTISFLYRNRERYDVVHCQQVFAPAVIGACAKLLLKKPFLVGVHSTGSWGELNQLNNSPFRFLLARSLKMADAMIVLNPEMQAELQQLGVENEKIHFIPNGTRIPVDAAFEDGIKDKYAEQLSLPKGKIVVFTGRLSAEKGLDTLVRAWQQVVVRVPDANLLIIGKGGGFPDIELEIKQLCRELKLEESVHFLGFRSNPFDYLLASDVFVLSSDTEGFGMSILEAMACGTPVVATATSGGKVLIEDGGTGKLVPVKEPAHLAKAIIEILENPELGHRLARAAREKAIDKFSIETMGKRFLSVYSQITRGGRAGSDSD